ncbi:hypothetical protein H5410_057823, partial [Solanum commersonii]
DCEIYLLAFAKYLSEGEDTYGALLWEYTSKKMEEGAISENEAPPRMIRPPTRIDNSQLVRID